MTSEELMASAVPSSSFEEARRKTLDEVGKQLFDEVQLRQQEDWAALANQAVGAEHVLSQSVA